MTEILKNVKDLGKGDIKTIQVYGRTFFGLPANSRLEVLYRQLGTHNIINARSQLLQLYNRHIKEEYEKEKKKRRFEKILKLARARIIIKPHIDFTELGKFVKNWYRNKKGAFSLTLKSSRADIKHTWKFHAYKHFDNWFEKLTTENADSAGNIEFTEGNRIFDGIIIVDDINLISGGCNKNKAGNKKMKSSFYEYKLFNPCGENNNCFFACLRFMCPCLTVDSLVLRKLFKIPFNTPITVDMGYVLMRYLKIDIVIIDYDTNEELNSDIAYIILKDNHYYALESFEPVFRKDNKTKRGLLTFDFETRKTENFLLIGESNKNKEPTKSFYLKDSICGVYYRDYKSEEKKHIIFKTNDDKTSSRQFIDWLNLQAKKNKSYNIISHNGSNFDNYFIIAQFTKAEQLESEIQMRGTSIIGINYRGNLFKDSYCFMTTSLSNICKSFKIEHGKITTMDLHDKKITSSQLCFYKPELTFNAFIELEQNDPEFWKLYTKYCLYDCIALFEIWERFTECVNDLINKINPFILKKCSLMSCLTIGSHSKKIITELNKFKGKSNYYKKDIEIFTGKTSRIVDNKEVYDIDKKKYDFLCNFKRGGISHCNKMGKHLSGIVGVDIASQYPSALINAYCPLGESYWIDFYDGNDSFGFYHIKNLVFTDNMLFKPIAKSNEGLSLNWATNEFNDLYIDSYMLDYVIKNHGLKTFDVITALVSNRHIKLSKVFGKYVETFYTEKKLQDKLKSDNDATYNPALRDTIKLYLNSLTGKLVENPEVHFSLGYNEDSLKLLNGLGVEKIYSDKLNDWLITGIMVYSYSKRLLFEYISCLPNKSDDVIHVETDGIYFSLAQKEQFEINLANYKGDYPCVMGDDLGNLKIEKTTEKGSTAYFLGKKFYQFGETYRIKGLSQETISEDGSKIRLVDKQLYEDIYNGKKVKKEFATLIRKCWGEKMYISGHRMTRTISPNGKYNLYE